MDNQIYKLTLMIWRQEEIPDDWKTGVIMLVHKNGDKTCCENYRGITINHASGLLQGSDYTNKGKTRTLY